MAKSTNFLKFTNKDRDSFIQVLIAFSQITFGVAWGSIFLPVDQYKPFVILLNIVATITLLALIWLLNKR